MSMIDLGSENALFVAGVFELAERGPLLSPEAPLPREEREIVHDLEAARRHAYHLLSTGEELGGPDEDGFTWTDLRQDAMSDVWAETYGRPERASWRAARPDLEERLRPSMARLSAEHRAIADDIVADLAHCILSHAVFGADPCRLFAEVWSAYRDGGWPCGWTGDHPDGLLVVYEPTLRGSP